MYTHMCICIIVHRYKHINIYTYTYTYIYIYTCTWGVLDMGHPQVTIGFNTNVVMDGLIWMIWGYLHFRKPAYIDICLVNCIDVDIARICKTKANL